MENKTTLTLWISPSEEPQGGIYRHQEKESKGANRGPKHWRGRATTPAEMRPKPRFRSYTRAARAAPPAVRVASGPCRLYLLNFRFEHLGLTESPFKVKGYLLGF